MDKNNLPSLLLADDDEILCSVLARALRNREHRVLVAHDYQSAVTLATENVPDYAVIDLKLPGGSGLCLIKELLDLHPAMRVVVFTGYGSIATAIDAIRRGAHYYLTKPADADDIVSALHSESGPAPAPICDRPLSVSKLEWEHINRVLAAKDGNISATARALGMHRRTLQRKLNKHPVRD